MIAMKGNQMRFNVQRNFFYVAVSSTDIHSAFPPSSKFRPLRLWPNDREALHHCILLVLYFTLAKSLPSLCPVVSIMELLFQEMSVGGGWHSVDYLI